MEAGTDNDVGKLLDERMVTEKREQQWNKSKVLRLWYI